MPGAGCNEPWEARSCGASGGTDGSGTAPGALAELCWVDPAAPGTWSSTGHHPCVLQVRDRWASASAGSTGRIGSWRVAAWFRSPNSGWGPPRAVPVRIPSQHRGRWPLLASLLKTFWAETLQPIFDPEKTFSPEPGCSISTRLAACVCVWGGRPAAGLLRGDG